MSRFEAQAAALSALPPGERAARLAQALSEAYAAGAAESAPGPSLSGRSREIFDAIRKAAAEARASGGAGEVAFDQSALACPGQPWTVSIDGEPLLDGRYALPVPDATVVGMRGLGLLEPDGADRLVLRAQPRRAAVPSP